VSKKGEKELLPEYPPFSISGSDKAPILFFDTSSAFGFNDGVILISVEAIRMVSGAPEVRPVVDRVIVAHLRTTVSGAISLRDALNSSLAMVLAPPPSSKN
jgi:hypothetical protein